LEKSQKKNTMPLPKTQQKYFFSSSRWAVFCLLFVGTVPFGNHVQAEDTLDTLTAEQQDALDDRQDELDDIKAKIKAYKEISYKESTLSDPKSPSGVEVTKKRGRKPGSPMWILSRSMLDRELTIGIWFINGRTGLIVGMPLKRRRQSSMEKRHRIRRFQSENMKWKKIALAASVSPMMRRFSAV
jgi:DNA-binding cell septation regulator SpoVG